MSQLGVSDWEEIKAHSLSSWFQLAKISVNTTRPGFLICLPDGSHLSLGQWFPRGNLKRDDRQTNGPYTSFHAPTQLSIYINIPSWRWESYILRVWDSDESMGAIIMLTKRDGFFYNTLEFSFVLTFKNIWCKLVLEKHHFFSHSNPSLATFKVVRMPGLHYSFTTLSISKFKHFDQEAEEIAQLVKSFQC